MAFLATFYKNKILLNFQKVDKWLNFAQSGHTDSNLPVPARLFLGIALTLYLFKSYLLFWVLGA
jgi:hypothetical protein